MAGRNSINTLYEKAWACFRRFYRMVRYRRRTIWGELTIDNRSWRVEMAITRQQRYLGLGGRDKLTEGTGMLFIYPNAGIREFSMRGCVVPLDIIFFSPTLEVIGTCTMSVEPERTGRVKYISPAPAQYILEVAAGECSAAGVRVGSVARLSPNTPSAVWADL